jgi:hypothetical protein
VRIFLIAFGKLKAPGIRETVDYYVRNAKAFSPIEEIELKPLPVPDKSPATRALIQAKEAEILGERLGKLLSARGVFYLSTKKERPRSRSSGRTSCGASRRIRFRKSRSASALPSGSPIP